MPVRPPSGTVTFLVTTIQDSLRRWDEAPAEMAAAKGVHDAMVRDAIEGHGGHVFATDGDGFCAAFATAVSARSSWRSSIFCLGSAAFWLRRLVLGADCDS